MLAVAQAAERDLRLYPPAGAGYGAGAAAHSSTPYAAMLGLEGEETSGSCGGLQQQLDEEENCTGAEGEGGSLGTERGGDAAGETGQRDAGITQGRGGGQGGENGVEPVAKRQRSQSPHEVVYARSIVSVLHRSAMVMSLRFWICRLFPVGPSRAGTPEVWQSNQL